MRFGAVSLDACLEFFDAIKVNGITLSLDMDDNSVWVVLSEGSVGPYYVYCSVANWANSHGVDILSGDGCSFGLQRKVDGKGDVSPSFIWIVCLWMDGKFSGSSP